MLALLVRAEIAYRRGDLGAAVADLRAAQPLCERAGAGSLGAATMAMLARVLLARGEADDIPAMAGEFDPKAGSHVFIAGLEQEARGMIAASRGDHRQALHLYLDCGRLLTANGLQNPACSAWRSRAVVTMVGQGRVRKRSGPNTSTSWPWARSSCDTVSIVRTTPFICGRQASETMAMRNRVYSAASCVEVRRGIAASRRACSWAQWTMRRRPSKSSTRAVQLSTQSPSLQ